MRRARSWLDKHGFKIRQVADWMYKSCRIFAVLCEAARNVTAKRCHVLAQQWFSADAMEACQTRLHGIGCDSVAD
jgi:hypothetical protein